MNKLRWGILSSGRIARRFATALKSSSTGVLTAVASRDTAKAQAFAGEFGAVAHSSYQALLEDPEVEAVYIATPHPHHAEWAIRAARAGKHILCEKPAGLSAGEVEAMLVAAEDNGVFFMEAFMYRCHPQTARVVELIQSGAIGTVGMIRCTFSFAANPDKQSRLFANRLGGGGILDVGCYCVSMARLLAGAAVGADFAEPLEVEGMARLDAQEGTDLYAAALLEFPGGILAQLSTGVGLMQENAVNVFGDKGSLTVTQPWMAGASGAKIVIRSYGINETSEIVTETAEDLYSYEIDLVARTKADGQAPSPAMTWEDSLGNARTLDAWREKAGVVYEAEHYANAPGPLGRARLSAPPSAAGFHAPLPGLRKPMSRLVMGGMLARSRHGQIVLDEVFELGGNAFDTAFIYGSGEADRALGHWIASRGVRDEVVVIAKGAHTPYCHPEDLTAQLHASLEALQTDHADLYIMHRDNKDIPVGEFIDVLNKHLNAGRFHAFGCSNWSIERLVAANDYAKAKNLTGFCVLNNQLSLARMVDPVWAGCLSVSDRTSREWLARNSFPVLAWSSQARGFFTDRAHPEKKDDPEMVRCWHADDNFERKRRAAGLARKMGCEEINIALAYVLAQPFPVWTLIGPATIREARSCFKALDVTLTPEEMKWLNLED